MKAGRGRVPRTAATRRAGALRRRRQMLLARHGNRTSDRQGPGIGGRQERTTIVAQAAAPGSLPPAQQADSQVGPAAGAGAGVRSQVAVAVDTSCRLTPATIQVPVMRCSLLSSSDWCVDERADGRWSASCALFARNVVDD